MGVGGDLLLISPWSHSIIQPHQGFQTTPWLDCGFASGRTGPCIWSSGLGCRFRITCDITWCPCLTPAWWRSELQGFGLIRGLWVLLQVGLPASGVCLPAARHHDRVQSEWILSDPGVPPPHTPAHSHSAHLRDVTRNLDLLDITYIPPPCKH